MKNVEFIYLYRDGGNYKKWGKVVFSNADRLDCESVERQLQQAFLQDGLFIASQIGVPDAFLYAGGMFSLDDHCYHEFEMVRPTLRAVDDAHGRSIRRFLIDVTREAELGWREFDPYDSEGSLGSYLTSRALGA
jgi:hypothetical protein